MCDSFTITLDIDRMKLNERERILKELRAWQATERTVKQSIQRLQKELAEVDKPVVERVRVMA